MKKKFLENAWYPAAWDYEIDDSMICRTIAGQDVLMFRDEAGDIQAMSNSCPHRLAPLHKGKLIDGNVQCPYHALEFDVSGKCVKNPNGNNKIPRNSDLRVYKVVEKHAMIWVWLGKARLAKEKHIPDFSCHSNPDMVTVRGIVEIDAYYELLTDNLLDLTHLVTLHEDSLGSQTIASGKTKVSQHASTVRANTWCEDGAPPPAWSELLGGYEEPVHYWLNARWDAPASILSDFGVTPIGKTRGEGLWIYSADILCPVDSTKTRYFWAITQTSFGEDEITEGWREAIEHVILDQDKPILEAQQKTLQARGYHDIDEYKRAAISTDAGPSRARSVTQKLRNAEVKDSVPKPQNLDLGKLLEESEASDEIKPVV